MFKVADGTIKDVLMKIWSREENRDVKYAFNEGNTKLTVTVESLEEDDFDAPALLTLLGERGVISKPKDWHLRTVGDNSGDTTSDDHWCTAVFTRTIPR